MHIGYLPRILTRCLWCLFLMEYGNEVFLGHRIYGYGNGLNTYGHGNVNSLDNGNGDGFIYGPE